MNNCSGLVIRVKVLQFALKGWDRERPPLNKNLSYTVCFFSFSPSPFFCFLQRALLLCGPSVRMVAVGEDFPSDTAPALECMWLNLENKN